MNATPRHGAAMSLAVGATVAGLVFVASAQAVPGQSRGPSSIYDAQTPGQQATYNRVVGERPPFIIGWNWSAMLLQPNTDLATNFLHMENPWRWAPNYADWTRPYFTLNNLPARTRLAIAPSDAVPEADIPILYAWYNRVRELDENSFLATLPLDVGKGTATGLSEAMGMRFHPEIDVSDTSHFVAKHGNRQPAAFGFRERTFSNSSSLFHPVIANAVVRMDTLTWQGYIDDSLHTYMDSLRINHGNISDSALAINYNVLGAAGYQTLRNRNLEGQGAYWMGLTHFTPLM
jgi:hypothetical protein